MKTPKLLISFALLACIGWFVTSVFPMITEMTQNDGITVEQVKMPDGEYIFCAVHDGYREASLDCPDDLLIKHGLVPDH